MIYRSIAMTAFALCLSTPASAQLTAENFTTATEEMYRLVQLGSESRRTLFCIEISTQIQMNEARGTFLRRMERYTVDTGALMLSLAYVAGASEANWREVGEGNLSEEVMAQLFGDQCMPLLLQ